MYFAIASHSDHTRLVYGESFSVTELSVPLSKADIAKLEYLFDIQYASGRRDATKDITDGIAALADRSYSR